MCARILTHLSQSFSPLSFISVTARLVLAPRCCIRSWSKAGEGILGSACASRSTGRSWGLPEPLPCWRECVLGWEKGQCPGQLLHVSHPFFLGCVCCFCSVYLFLFGSSHSADSGLALSPGWLQALQFFLRGSASGEERFEGSSRISPPVRLLGVLAVAFGRFVPSAWPLFGPDTRGGGRDLGLELGFPAAAGSP